MRLIISVLLLSLLTLTQGCTQTHIAPAQATDLGSRLAECLKQFNGSPPVTPAVRCEIEERRRAMNLDNSINDPVIGSAFASMAGEWLVYAERFDKKQMTRAEFNAAYLRSFEVQSRTIMARAQQIQLQHRQQAMMQQAMSAQLISSGARMMSPPTPPAPTTAHCDQFGSSIQCRSF